jgi:hypothetical protein
MQSAASVCRDQGASRSLRAREGGRKTPHCGVARMRDKSKRHGQVLTDGFGIAGEIAVDASLSCISTAPGALLMTATTKKTERDDAPKKQETKPARASSRENA